MIVNMIITMAMLIQAQEPVLWAPLLASAGPQRRGGRCGGLQKPPNLLSSETDASAQKQWCANMLQILAEPQLAFFSYTDERRFAQHLRFRQVSWEEDRAVSWADDSTLRLWDLKDSEVLLVLWSFNLLLWNSCAS